MPAEFEGVAFAKKAVVSRATVLDDRFARGTIGLVEGARQPNQPLAVNNNLQASRSPQGHGDPVWPASLALPEETASEAVGVRFVED